MTHGTFCWNELNTRNAEAAKKFYGETIGWTFDKMDMEGGGAYYICMQGETPVGGIFTMEGPAFDGMPEHWFAYLDVDDVDKRTNKAQAHGATIIRPPFDVPDVGRIAIVKDPSGAVMGWMTPVSRP
ncbi:VOC family protein [Rhizobiaceae bacterium n13]|uniref:VOC family protein n=1 Tax=Ferirhizobium litorale TaxID=2927786 RepID=A0AAE3QAW8_9HYPH|nr:VOC family protein [Fererhizobium litorale]MDI7861494.1 VOC family protein [Fererhizobium litorale]MDI7921640.1 VOC family protein [Fererhizobium litorale]